MKHKDESIRDRQDDKCHQCKSEHDVGEVNLRHGIYGLRAILCKEHTDAMIAHFKTLETRINAWRLPEIEAVTEPVGA